jgi:hypothetical protein
MTRRISLTLICAAVLALAAPAGANAAVSLIIVDDTLVISGDESDDGIRIAVNEELAKSLDVFAGGFSKRVNRDLFTKIEVRAGEGNDRVEMDDTFDAFGHQEQTTIEGEGGDDVLIGAGGAQQIRGGEGDDTLDGEGLKSSFGFAGNDALQGGAGNDTFLWDRRDLSDSISGGTEADRVEMDGNNDNETFTIGRSITTTVVQREPRSIQPPQDIVVRIASGTEVLDIDSRDGFDTITAAENVNGQIALDLDGGEQTDTITGGGGADVIAGGISGDLLHGGGGDDTISGNDGDDRLFGDAGTDTLDGGAGLDRFFCEAPGDRLIFEPEIDIVNESCLPLPADPVAPEPQPQPEPGPAPGEPPAGGQPGGEQPGGPGEQPGGGQPGGEQPLPVRGFAKPKVRATLRALTVTVRNTGTETLELFVGGTEKVGSRRFKHAKRRLSVAPGATRKVTFRSSTALRRALTRAARRGRVVRRPAITVADRATAAKATVKPRIGLRVR